MKEARETIAVIDMGGQYAHLLANRIRRLGTYAEIYSPDTPAALLANAKGILFSDSPALLHHPKRPSWNPELLELAQPKLAIGYSALLAAEQHGAKIAPAEQRAYRLETLQLSKTASPLTAQVAQSSAAWMSAAETIEQLPKGFVPLAQTKHCKFGAFADEAQKLYAIQFHPEVAPTEEGNRLLQNFLNICGCSGGWSMELYLDELSEALRKQAHQKKVFLLVSGGVDSTVAFVLLNKILGKERVMGLHIDSGMMRLGESADVMEFLQAEGIDNLQIADASETFLTALQGVTDPEEKRNIIGNTFLEVKDREIERLGLNPEEWLLAQGTIYPDTVESGTTEKGGMVKTHHNRVAAIVEMMEQGLVIEPLAELYKDEVRELGEKLGIPHPLVWRHPFPGPGLGVRLLCSDGQRSGFDLDQIDGLAEWGAQKGEELGLDHPLRLGVLPIRCTGVKGDERNYAQPLVLREELDWESCEKLAIEATSLFPDAITRVVLQLSGNDESFCKPIEQYCNRHSLDRLRLYDSVVTRFLHRHNLYNSIWQMPVVLLPLQHSTGYVVVLRPINSSEAMTAQFARIDRSLLQELIDELTPLGVGTILYDVTHKPPGTIEWE